MKLFKIKVVILIHLVLIKIEANDFDSFPKQF